MKPDLALSAATIARFLVKEKHSLVHTKPFFDLLLSLAPHMDDVQAEWAAMQPTPELADAYVSSRLDELNRKEKAFAERQAKVMASNKATIKKIKSLANTL